MLGTIRKAAVLAAMLGVGFGMSGTALAQDINFSDTTDNTLAKDKKLSITSSEAYYVQASGNNANINETGDIEVKSNSLWFGTQADAAGAVGKPFSYTLSAGTVGSNTYNGQVELIAGTLGLKKNSGTTVQINKLLTSHATTSFITVEGGNNTLKVGSLAPQTGGYIGGTLEVGTNSSFIITESAETTLGGDTATNTVFNIKLTGGTADFRGTSTSTPGSIVLKNGTISGSGTIKGDTTLSSGTTSGNGEITLTNSDNLLFTDNVINQLGEIDITTTSASNKPALMTVDKDLTLRDGSTTTVNGDSANAGIDVKGTLNVYQESDTGFTIKGDNGGTGMVKAGSLVMLGTSDSSKSQIAVTDNGILSTGNNPNGTTIDDLSLATITVSGSGEAMFNNIVALNGDSDILAKDGGTVTFNNKVVTDGDSNQLIADAGTIVFKKELDLQDGDNLTLDNGGKGDYSAVAGGLTLGQNSGQIVSLDTSGNGDINQFYATSLTGDRKDAVTIENGSTLQLLTAASTPSTYVASEAESIKFDSTGGGTFEVGDMVIADTQQGNIYNALSNTTNNEMVVKGQLNVGEQAVAIGSQYVNTMVEKNANIYGTYKLADNNTNTFNGDILVNGSNAVLGSVTIAELTQADGKTLAVKNGGTLGSGGTLNINSNSGDPETTILFNGSGTNTVYGLVNADKADTLVNSNLVLDGELTTNTYTQTYGNVTAGSNFSSSKLIVKDVATIAGASSSFSTNGTFLGGLDVLRGAKLIGNDNVIQGNTTLGGTRPVLNVDSSSSIDLSNKGMAITGFKDINVGGTILIGYNSGDGEPNVLTLDNDTTLHTDVNNSIKFTNDFVKAYYDKGSAGAQDWIIENGTINDGTPGSWSNSTLYGDFTFTYNDPNKDGAYVSLFEKRNISDLNVVSNYLSNNYFGQDYMTENIVGNMSGIANGTINSNGTMGGNLNMEIFNAMAQPNSDRTFSFMGRTGSLTKDLFAVMSGTPSAAPIYIAQDSVRHVMGTLDTRLDAFRKVKEHVINECFSSDTALGSADIMNARYLNRVWAGALGNWQSASERKGYEGYKYKPAGGIVGYDRAFGAAIVGTSFAFMEGNYTDKTFEWNDSKIRQYDANLYATYNFSSGFFTTVKAGYEYQRNKLNYGSYGPGANKFDEKSSTHTLYASGKLGYDIMPCDNFSITPSIGVNYFHSKTSGHDVNWNNVELMRYDSMKNYQVELPIKVEVAYEIPFSEKSGLTMSANGGYSYNFTDRGVRGDISNIGLIGTSAPTMTADAVGRKQGHHAWMGGAGAKFRYDNWEVGVKYDYYGRSNANSHQVTGVVGYSF